MVKQNRNTAFWSFASFLFYTLFCIIPFIQSIHDSDTSDLYKQKVLPAAVSSTASYVRWAILGFIALMAAVQIQRIARPSPVLYFLWLFYLVQLIYSVATLSDVPRYFLLFLQVVIIPSFLLLLFLSMGVNRKILNYIVFGFVGLSILLNINSLLAGFRFLGFVNNSNLYGLTALFWMTILMIPEESKSAPKIRNIVLFILSLTIIFSGSRNGLIGFAVLLFFTYVSAKIKNIMTVFFLAVVIGFFLVNNLAEFPVVNRLTNISNAISDSGRSNIWNGAWNLIKYNPVWGYGMNAPLELVNAGNMHNCYLRYLLMMGLFFGGISIFFYFLFLVKVFANRKQIPGSLVGFLFAFTVMNIGEDYFVGVGSSAFLYFCIVIALILYYHRLAIAERRLTLAQRTSRTNEMAHEPVKQVQ